MYYDEAEVLDGSDAQARAAMLDHFDSMLQIPRDAGIEEVNCIITDHATFGTMQLRAMLATCI